MPLTQLRAAHPHAPRGAGERWGGTRWGSGGPCAGAQPPNPVPSTPAGASDVGANPREAPAVSLLPLLFGVRPPAGDRLWERGSCSVGCPCSRSGKGGGIPSRPAACRLDGVTACWWRWLPAGERNNSDGIGSSPAGCPALQGGTGTWLSWDGRCCLHYSPWGPAGRGPRRQALGRRPGGGGRLCGSRPSPSRVGEGRE